MSTQGQRIWTTAEIKALRLVAHLGAPAAARLLRRSPEAVRQQAKRAGISLARPNKDDDRRRLDPARAEELVSLLGALVPLCRRCDIAPTETGELVGLCRGCRWDDIATAHAITADELRASKRLAAERQRIHRAVLDLRRRSARVAWALDVVRWENDHTDLRPRPTFAVWKQRYATWFPSKAITSRVRESAQSPQDAANGVQSPPTASKGSRRSDAVSPP